MQSIQVFSDILKGGNVADNFAAPKEKAVSERPSSAANAFAALFGSFLKSGAVSKGQQSSNAGPKFESPVSGVKNSNAKDDVPENGGFVFSIFAQSASQSNPPAGTEANSGYGTSQEINMLLVNEQMNMLSALTAGKNWDLALANLLSLLSDEAFAQLGMTKAQAQGITELDQYKQFIDALLAKLSGEIVKDSPEGKNPALETLKAGELTQDNLKIIQNWISSLNPHEKEKLTSPENQRGQAGAALEGEGREAKPGADKLVTELNRILHKVTQEARLNAKGEGSGQELKAGPGESLTKGHKTQAADVSSVKPGHDQTLAAAVAVNNISTAALQVPEGKSAASAVWEQITNALRDQLLHRQEGIRQLDLQLHPAELGKIQIALRWENGQLHMQDYVLPLSIGMSYSACRADAFRVSSLSFLSSCH